MIGGIGASPARPRSSGAQGRLGHTRSSGPSWNWKITSGNVLPQPRNEIRLSEIESGVVKEKEEPCCNSSTCFVFTR
ncbi:hypothetical protein E2C01_088633 [Portunus trituberculatus]|uniref:Uncharacterized protein n=1 Tax=Portunus trituberculatus TaxID=210409 RepID=A0A5B7JB99_PORTR|nr:hypothetical protein [Portunus trituberculatus]